MSTARSSSPSRNDAANTATGRTGFTSHPDWNQTLPFAPWRLPLAQILDSAAPTGTFSHSFGMETALVRGVVHDADSCAAWLRAYLFGSLVLNDALATRLAAQDLSAEQLCDLSDYLEASVMAPEARRANSAVGRRMLQIAADGFGIPVVQQFAELAGQRHIHPHPALVAAAVGCGLGAPWQETCGLYLYSCLTSLVQNAVRAIPLGQVAGQAVLAGLTSPVVDAVMAAEHADEHDLGASSPLLDVYQCEHETQLGRMFIS
ncbi:urease accessory protein UreF [Propionibacterium sp.]|uniref:urease accessory protein UreF n=1 Tax=Propionibacterium sp. TaxID=1977903 RepID=UPI0039EA3580